MLIYNFWFQGMIDFQQLILGKIRMELKVIFSLQVCPYYTSWILIILWLVDLQDLQSCYMYMVGTFWS